MPGAVGHFFDKASQGQPPADLLAAPPDALRGVSAADAAALAEQLSIHSVEDLARNPYFQRALAVLDAAGHPKHDPGPPVAWAEFFEKAPIAHYENHPANRFRIDFGPVYYRGRLDGTARLLVVGQDPSTNEILAQRVFVGRSGQRIQGLLRKLGLNRSYVMLNTFLFSVFGQFDTQLRHISLEPTILDYRNAYLDRVAAENPLEAVIAVGNGAQHAVGQWAGSANLPVFEITHPAAPDEPALLANWNASLSGLQDLLTPDDTAAGDPEPYGTTWQAGDEESIPAHDLPFGLPAWHGNQGSSFRDGNKRIIWNAP